MQAVTAERMRWMDRETIASGVASGIELMDRAGYGLARGIRRLCAVRGLAHPAIRMVAGKGNNGGDVFAAAYHLYRHFPDLEIVLVGDFGQLQGETRWHYERIHGQVACTSRADAADWRTFAWHGGVDVVVDGLLGTGFRGTPREPVAGAIRAIHRARREGALVVAVDIPSGVCADSGVVSGEAIVADCTFTMGLPKYGMLQPAAVAFPGHVEVLDIGIPVEIACLAGLDQPPQVAAAPEDGAVCPGPVQCVSGNDVRHWLVARSRDSHKGNYGRILIVGGAPGYSGAVALAARAACRSGAGLVHVLTPASVVERVAQYVPEAMVHAGARREDGGLAAAALHSLADPGIFDVVLVGPGLTCHPEGEQLLEKILALPAPVVVVDADGLTLLARSRQRVLPRSAGVLVLTPHPGEAARMLDRDPAAVQQDRCAAIQSLTRQYDDAIVALKGAGTLLSRGGDVWVNLTGNPGLATGGTGDVLAGMVAGLAGQGLGGWEAACAAVHVHGVAGDLGAWAGSELGLTATGLLDMLPRAFGWVLGH